MSSTDFTLNILATLNKQLSKKRLQGDLKSLDNTMFIKVIAKLATTLSQKQLKKDLKKLNDLYVQIGANVNVDKNTKTQIQNRIKELQKSLSELEVNLKVSKAKTASEIESVRKEVQAKAKKAPIEFDIEVKRSKAIADIEYLGKRFSKLFTNVAAKQKYENILASAYSITDENQLKSVRNQISAFISELKACGLASQSLGDKWKNLIERAKNLFSAASIVTTIFTQVKQAVSTFLKLDTAMTNLYKVQDQIKNRDQFSGLLTKWNKLAQNLAVTTESLINATAEWSKIGFDLDMSEQLAQITAIFEKTAEISTEKASSTLISAAQAFTEIGNLGEDDYVARVEAIGDRINAIGNKYSISSEGISDALQNSSAALKVAGNDLDETIALITAANKIFQSPSEVSNMLKVASMRLRGQVDALEEMGEDVTGVSTDITKIQQQIYELTGNKVNIFEDEDTLKSTYQMILEIGEVFDSLNDRSQADLLEVMFGKQRSSAGASLLLNYEELEKIKNDSMSAANSMAEEYSKYMESAEAHITIFKEKLVETYSTFISGDLIKYMADVGSGILDLVNATDLLKHGILVVLALNVSKGITAVGTAIASTAKQMNTLGGALQQIKSLPVDKFLRKSAIDEIGEATQNLTEKNLQLLLSHKSLRETERIAILEKHNLTKEETKAKLEKMGLTTATKAQSAANVTEAASTNVLRGAMGSLKASIIAVGTSIKAAFMSNPLTFILTGITTVISLATTAISSYKQKQEEAAQALQDAVSEYKSAKSSLESINSELEEQNKKMDELLKKDKLTYAEKGQLEELQAITKELKLQQDIEERRTDKASKEAAKKTIDAYKKQYGKYDKTEDKMKEMYSYIFPGISADKNDVLGNIGEYISATKSLEKSQEDYQNALAEGKDLSWYDENIQYHIDRLDNRTQILNDNISDLQEKQLSLEDEYQKAIAKRESGLDLTTFDKEVIESYEEIFNLIRIVH